MQFCTTSFYQILSPVLTFILFSSDVDIKDLNENQKQWMIVGFCLHSIIAPLLRFVLEQAIKQLYTTLVTTSQIDTQMHPNIVGRYPMPTGYRLNYASINNNAAHGRNIRNYDYRVKDYVDLSKLFFYPTWLSIQELMKRVTFLLF